jgi:uncharacterized membrane protein YdjX (TVP38/TMEM64 family)
MLHPRLFGTGLFGTGLFGTRRQALKTIGRVAIACLISMLLSALIDPFPADAVGFNPPALLRDSLAWIQDLGAVGAIVFIGIYAIATIAFFPGSILTLGAGVIFGVLQGALYVWIGATLGATLAFLIGRYLARDWVFQKIADTPKFRAIDAAVGRAGLKIVLLTRLSPIFPFNLLNYAFGGTSVSLKDYMLGCVGMIPGTILYVYIGSLAGNIAAIGTASQLTAPTVQWTIRIVGLVAAIAVTLYITQIARKALAEALPDSLDPDSP